MIDILNWPLTEMILIVNVVYTLYTHLYIKLYILKNGGENKSLTFIK